MPVLRQHHDRPPLIFDTVDLHYLREQRRAELQADGELAREALLVRSTELYLAHASDMVWVVSPYEVEVLHGENPTLPVEIVPLVHATRAGELPFAARRDLVFIGGFRHLPNGDAVRYFVEEVFPLVRRAIPEARFQVVGTDIPPDVEALASESVAVVGYVKELDALLDRCRLSVAPLRYGAGLKGKITQSLASGLPVVTTTVGAEGLNLKHREHAMIADDRAELAASVVELYQDEELWRRLSETGRRHVEEHFGYDVVTARVEHLLEKIFANQRTLGPQ
jgi:glycosyltransferase involved in cell wall biosynthesis